MIDPNEKPNRDVRLTKDGTVADFKIDANSESSRGMAGDVFDLELLSRRRLQKKFFIAKARRDVA